MLAACGGGGSTGSETDTTTSRTTGTGTTGTTTGSPTSGTTGGATTPTPTTPVTTTDPATPPTTAAPAHGVGSHRRCGWIGGGETIGEQSFVAHAAEFDAIHPKWWVMEPDGVNVRKAGHWNEPSVIAAAREHGVQIIPLVDQDMDKNRLRRMINDPAKRTAHVNVLVGIVMDNNYDGIDIDYEGLWSGADRAPFLAFMKELGEALHAKGKELSMAAPGLGKDLGDNAYAYEQLVADVDTIHIMGYDFHNTSSHMGPLAPLGWIDAVFARAQATGAPERFILGLANYAIGSSYFTTTRDAISQCQGGVEGTTDHMASCSFDRYEAGRAPHCQTGSHGTLWFEDVASMTEKIRAAKAHGARGVTYWTVGDELDGFFEMMRTEFPRAN
jgi:spore germination protein YaaH